MPDWKLCERCGEEFFRPTHYYLTNRDWGRRRFCSPKCSARTTAEKRFGRLHPTCECGCGQWCQHRYVPGHKPPARTITSSGYVRLYRPEHPLADKKGAIREHRYVLYEAGVAIPPGHVVHHINGDKTDNRLENLKVMSAQEHALLHARQRGLVTPEERRRRNREYMRARRLRSIA